MSILRVIIFAIVTIGYKQAALGVEYDCRQCDYSLVGDGFLPHEYCRAYIRCEENANVEGGFILHVMCCPKGEIWDQDRLTCVKGFSRPGCNAPTPDGLCRHAGDVEQDTPCPYSTDPDDESRYMVAGASRPCAPTTVFSEQACACVGDGFEPICEQPIHFRFDDDYNSYSCNNFVHGERHSYPVLQDGAVCFDGVDDFVEFNFFNNYFVDNPSATAFSIAAWIKPTGDVHFAGIVSNGNCYQTASYAIVHLGREVMSKVVTQYDEAAFLDTYDESRMFGSFGVWSHVAIVYTGSELNMYVDGTRTGSLPASGPIANVQTSTVIGMYPTADPAFFSGCIDDVMVFTRALSEDQLLDLVNDGRSVP